MAINASLAGVLKENENTHYFDNIYGSLNGITGVINDRLINLSEKVKESPSFLEKLKVTPAMYLGSCRYKLPDPNEDRAVYESIAKYFEKKEIDTFFYIGGNDSMDTVYKLSLFFKETGSPVKAIGIPKTIDNDLTCTDHTPGFGSAAKYIATTVREICHDTSIYPVKSVTIVEIMGRDAGWLTAAAALSRTDYYSLPQHIYLPEVAFSMNAFIEDVKKAMEKSNSVVVAISEGIRDEKGNYISAGESSEDTFGHSQLSGAGKALEYAVKDALGVKVRSIEINLPQRCASHLASLTDLDESMMLGAKAVGLSAEGLTGVMATVNRVSDDPYKAETSYADINDIANRVKNVPREWINAEGNDVTEDIVAYLRPLIQGEPKIDFVDGVPEYLPVVLSE